MPLVAAEFVAHEVPEIAERTAQQYPWTRPYVDERTSYARAILDEEDIRRYLDDIGPLDENYEERPAVRTLARFRSHAAQCRRELGLTPMAHAKLLALVSEVIARHPERAGGLPDGSLDALVAQGRALLDSAQRPELPS